MQEEKWGCGSVDTHLQLFGLAVTEILKVNVLFQREHLQNKRGRVMLCEEEMFRRFFLSTECTCNRA